MGARYLRHLLNQSRGNLRQALIAYNQGLTSLQGERVVQRGRALRRSCPGPASAVPFGMRPRRPQPQRSGRAARRAGARSHPSPSDPAGQRWLASRHGVAPVDGPPADLKSRVVVLFRSHPPVRPDVPGPREPRRPAPPYRPIRPPPRQPRRKGKGAARSGGDGRRDPTQSWTISSWDGGVAAGGGRVRGDGPGVMAAEDGGVAGAGAGGDVAGQAVPGQEAEDGEGVGLLGGRRDAEVVDGAQAGRGDALGEGPHEDGVLGAAAGGDDLGHAVAAALGGGHLGGVGGERGDEVVGGEVSPEVVQRRLR